MLARASQTALPAEDSLGRIATVAKVLLRLDCVRRSRQSRQNRRRTPPQRQLSSDLARV